MEAARDIRERSKDILHSSMRRQVTPPCGHPDTDQADDKDSVPDLIGPSDEEPDVETTQ